MWHAPAVRAGFLHGFAGDPAAWAATLAALATLAPDLEPRAVTLPGHGDSPVLPTWDENLAAVARALGDVELVAGYSFGARVALGLVAAGLAPRAILIGVNPGIDDADRPARRAGDVAWARLLRDRGIAAFADAWQAQPLFASQSRAAPALLAARRARRLALDPEQLARSLEVMGLAAMPDYRPAAHAAARAGTISLVAGADDAKFVAIARALPAPLTLIAESGHDPTLEQPALLAAALADLIHRPPSPPL
jgi:2-succinyl-6-hydroxy-2,4-cyclohexadiene-1-carboxylate synthase